MKFDMQNDIAKKESFDLAVNALLLIFRNSSDGILRAYISQVLQALGIEIE